MAAGVILPPDFCAAAGRGLCGRDRRKQNDRLAGSNHGALLWSVLADFHPQVLDIPDSKGQEPVFECFIWIGYVFGIVRKFLLYKEAVSVGAVLGWLFYLSWFFYVLNITAVTIDMCLYYRNVKLDRARERAAV